VTARVSLACVAWTLGVAAHGTTSTSLSYSPTKLTATEARVVAHQSCPVLANQPAERLRAYRMDWRHDRSAAKLVMVDCKPHAGSEGSAQWRRVDCEGSATDWHCEIKATHLRLRLGGAPVEVEVTGAQPEQAVAALQWLDQQGWRATRRPGHNIAECTADDPGAPEWLRVTCVGWSVTVSTWCLQVGCPPLVKTDVYPRATPAIAP